MPLPEFVRLRFLGATQTVTGSKYLLSYKDKKILVDCGLFQGMKSLRLKNWEAFPVDPKTIEAIILTHAHVDHSGYIPRLIKDGFRGKIFCTPGTLALCKILLPDTGYLQEEEAEYQNRRKTSKHSPALPLFTQEEAERALEQFVPRNFHEEFEPSPGFKIKFLYAGHILGAAMALIKVGKKIIAFSGDVGRLQDPVFHQPDNLPPVDALIVESTYGDRRHPDNHPMVELERIINQAVVHKSVVLIPAFAVGRTQTLLHFLAQLKKAKRIPEFPMFLNSPMATTATDVLCQFRTLHKLSDLECDELQGVVRCVRSVEESKSLNDRRGPMLIISASGMATGGRILHHLKAFAANPNNVILLTGFQAAGTRGRSLQDGAKEIKIFGEIIPVHAHVQILENLSAHADYAELLQWLERSRIQPKQVFVTHGEPESAHAFRQHLVEKFGWNCVVPQQDQEILVGGVE